MVDLFLCPGFQLFRGCKTLNRSTHRTKTMKKILALLAIGVLALSCIEQEDIEDFDVDYIQNIPVAANTPNAFSFVIKAEDFTQQIRSSLVFDSASFVTALVVAEYSEGSFSLVVYNADSSQMYSQEVTSNMVFTDFPMFQPASLELVLDGFSGDVNLAISAR